ncbi:MAG: pectinesterase family protein [Alistipes sp.]|nr:pectinesterase family protein [Alistipes sp.]
MKKTTFFLFFVMALMASTSRLTASGRYEFTVDPSGAGDFTTIREAIDAMPDYGKGPQVTIFIRNGVYREKVDVGRSKHNLRFVGEDRDSVVIVYDDHATRPDITGTGIGTSGSATVFVHGDKVTMENITFVNDAGPVGQAVAVSVTGDKAVFRNCRFLGFQDTLYCRGPEGRQYFEECYIEGTIDFIFGFTTAVFNRCEIRSKSDSYITAAGTLEGKQWGFLFIDCRLTAEPGVSAVYLGRAWRPYARTAFIRCEMGDHIVPAGWDDWGKPEARENSFYAEWGNTGPGSDLSERVGWMHKLTAEEAARFTVAEALAGSDGWNPVTGEDNSTDL